MDLSLNPSHLAVTAATTSGRADGPIADAAAAMAAWAAARRLSPAAVGVLEEATPHLRQGRGMGEHRAALHTGNSLASVMDVVTTRGRPERESFNVHAGALSQGVHGTVAHHVHLEKVKKADGGTFHRGLPSTVVLVPLPSRSRMLWTLTSSPAGADVPAPPPRGPSTLTGAEDPRRIVVVAPATTLHHDGIAWRMHPYGGEELLDDIVSGPVRAAMAAAPAGTRVEVDYGSLCVVLPGAVVADGATLDALCRVATSLAESIARAAERHEPLTADRPLPGPQASVRRRWIEAGAATVDWARPPADLVAAREAYRGEVRRAGRARGRLGVILLVVVGLLGTAAWVAFTLFSGVIFGEESGMQLVVAAIGAVVGLGMTVAGARAVRGELHDERVDAAIIPWGNAAFAREYGRSRGLAEEDPHAVGRHLDCPLPGRPLLAWHGMLGGSTPGHLVVWGDPRDDRHWLLAAVAAPSSAPTLPAPMVAEIRGGLCLVHVQVGAGERSAANLDAVAEAGALAAAS